MQMEVIFKRSAVTKVLTHSRCLVMMERRSCFPATVITGEPMTRIFLLRTGLNKTNWEIGSLGSARDWEIWKSLNIGFFYTGFELLPPPLIPIVIGTAVRRQRLCRRHVAKGLPTSDF